MRDSRYFWSHPLPRAMKLRHLPRDAYLLARDHAKHAEENKSHSPSSIRPIETLSRPRYIFGIWSIEREWDPLMSKYTWQHESLGTKTSLPSNDRVCRRLPLPSYFLDEAARHLLIATISRWRVKLAGTYWNRTSHSIHLTVVLSGRVAVNVRPRITAR